MNKLIFAFCLFAVCNCCGQSIQFSNRNFEQVKALAKKDDKIIFIDAYTSWCGPCREMEKNVFTDNAVAAFYNSRFINAKYDMDKEGAAELKQYFPVYGYPCFIFIDANGTELHREYGYLDPSNFLKLGNTVLTPALRKPQVRASHEIMSEELSLKDVALIKEMFNLQEKIGHLVWQNWQPIHKAPLLYKTKKFDYLFDHPNPPRDFVKVYNNYWKGIVYQRTNTDSNSYQATLPVNRVATIMISAPEKDDNPCLWELKACHELFHIYQYQNQTLIASPFREQYKSYNELTFPFNYKDEAVLADCRLEAEYTFDLLKKMQPDSADKIVARKVYKDIFKVHRRLFGDSLQVCYKQWMEWNEGVARYTERELAMHVMDENQYTATEDFTQYFKNKYSDPEIKNNYAHMLNPIRFVGEGVRGIVMFYYLGMGKAYLLDSLHKDWKMDYFKKNLDDLIISN